MQSYCKMDVLKCYQDFVLFSCNHNNNINYNKYYKVINSNNNNNSNSLFKYSPQGSSVSNYKNLVFKYIFYNYYCDCETTDMSLISMLVKVVVLCPAYSNCICKTVFTNSTVAQILQLRVPCCDSFVEKASLTMGRLVHEELPFVFVSFWGCGDWTLYTKLYTKTNC